MNFLPNSFARTVVKAVSISTVVGGLLISAHAFAQDPYPPAEFIATVDPVYYEGHAAYYYGNRWYYRDDHGGWQHYDREPPALADRRLHNPPARHDYGHAAGHGGGRVAPPPRGGGGGGHGGGRGGGHR